MPKYSISLSNAKRYAYVGETFRAFPSLKKMREFAEDETHTGTYYVSCTDTTFTYTREQIVGGFEK